MLNSIKHIPLHRVFHGIRFKVNKVDCRETINFFLHLFKSPRKECGKIIIPMWTVMGYQNGNIIVYLCPLGMGVISSSFGKFSRDAGVWLP